MKKPRRNSIIIIAKKEHLRYKNLFTSFSFQKILLATLFLLFCCAVEAQHNQKKETDTLSTPSWITMMDDSNVNYYKAVEAFNAYWKNREKPVDEDELFGSVGDKEKEEAVEEKHERHDKDDPVVKYIFEYKRFLWWQTEMIDFVKPDGHIKTMDERINDWKIKKQLTEAQEPNLKKKLSDIH